MALPSETLAPDLALPLRVKPAESTHLREHFLIVDANGRKVALVGAAADAERRAQQIVDAVNAYPDLLAAVRAGTQFAREVAGHVESLP